MEMESSAKAQTMTRDCTFVPKIVDEVWGEQNTCTAQARVAVYGHLALCQRKGKHLKRFFYIIIHWSIPFTDLNSALPSLPLFRLCSIGRRFCRIIYSTYQPSIYLSVHISIHLYLSVYLSILISIYLLSICKYIYKYIYPINYPLSIHRDLDNSVFV